MNNHSLIAIDLAKNGSDNILSHFLIGGGVRVKQLPGYRYPFY